MSAITHKHGDDLPPSSIDMPCMIGMLVAAAAIIVTLLGFLIPFFPWIASGLLGFATLALGSISRSKERVWVIAAGLAALIPSAILMLITFFLTQNV